MRRLTEFTPREWLQLLPVQHAMKQVRNDAWMAIYRRKRAPQLGRFLEETAQLSGKSIALVIAFEQPWYLDWLLHMANVNLADTKVLVFDNSKSDSKRSEIEEVCASNRAPYLALPANATKHVNRSHGMAMTWVYYNVVRAIEPRIFGFIDHDLIPVRPATIADKLADQPFYGLVNVGKLEFWSLWAGYCFFEFGATKELSLNFLYDFSRDLDTGGRNWDSLYRQFDRSKMRIASSQNVSMTVPAMANARQVQWVDRSWLHVGGVSYNESETPRDKIEFFRALENTLRQG
ncbi:MAG: hypothetical protein ABI771_07635 [Betaproteobacteria bacterium]